MKFGKIILYPVVICLLLGTGYFLGQKGNGSPLIPNISSVSSDIIFLTQPVYSFTGIIDKIEGNTVTAKQPVISYSPPGTVLTPGQTLPTPVIKFLTYKFTVNENTQINKSGLFVNYLFKTVTPAPPVNITLKDLRPGQQVNLQTDTDLRLNSKSDPDAKYINVQSGNNQLLGTISTVGDQTIKVLGLAPNQNAQDGNSPNAPDTKEYSIRLTPDTEISRYPPTHKNHKRKLMDECVTCGYPT